MANEETNQLYRDLIDLQKQTNELQKEAAKIQLDLDKNAPNYEQQKEILGAFNEIIEQNNERVKLLNTAYPELAEKTKQYAEAAKLAVQADKERTEIADDLVGKLGKLAGIQKDYNETLMGSVDELFSAGDGFKKLQESISKTFKPLNMLANLFEHAIFKSIALTKAADEQTVAFARNGGNVDRYAGSLRRLENAHFQNGISMDEASDSMLALQSGFFNLRKESGATQFRMLETTALLSEMGVNADTTAESMQIMTTALGVTGDEAARTQRELFRLAQSIDMPPNEMATAFKAAMPKLMAFGKQSEQVFKDLQINARAAGMEVNDVLSIVEQFDTFEGAAKSVGRLNAILGGPFLNSLEMVTTTDPSERMKMLSDAVNDAGVSFDQMDYYQRKALASAMGINEMQLAQLMANGFDQAALGSQMSQAELTALAEETAKFQTVMDELAQTGRLLATTFMPVVKMLKGFLDGVQKLVTAIPGLQSVLPPLILGIGGVTMATKALGVTLTRGPLGAAIAGLSLLIAAFTAETQGAKILLTALGLGFIAFSIAVAGGFTTMHIASM